MATAKDAGATTKNPIIRGKNFVAESAEELKKVTTPTRQETTQATLVTVVIIGIVALCLLLLDFVFHRLMGALLS